MYENKIDDAIRQLFEVSTLLTRLKHAIREFESVELSSEVNSFLENLSAKKKPA